MARQDIAPIRLINQHISSPIHKDANALLQHMGAMQAQDFRSSIWAVGLRLQGSKISDVEEAYNNGTILRTHVMRPTWHMVARENISWLLDLTAGQILSQTKGRHRDLGLTNQILNKCHSVIENELNKSEHLTREEILAAFKIHKLPVESLQLSHILMNAELHKIICSGKLKNKKLTYALFDERVQKQEKLDMEEALAKLAKMYFISHGPATAEDFQWWSGLPLGKVRLAISLIEQELSVRNQKDRKIYFSEDNSYKQAAKSAHFLLPAYDEFVISYKDRSDMLLNDTHARVISSNGIFRPVIVNGEGRVIGIWTQITKSNVKTLDFQFFEDISERASRIIEKEILRYGSFSDTKITVK